MNDLLPYIVVGLASGSVYGLAGVGLTLTYTTTGVFNFAHGAVAAAAAFIFFTLHVSWDVPWPLALALSVAGVGVVAGLGMERLSRHLPAASPASAVVATVGLLLVIQGLIQWRYGSATRQLAPWVEGTAVRIGDVAVSGQQATNMVIALASTAGLFAFIRASRVGAQMRAVVTNPDLLDLTGAAPNRVRTAAWVAGSSFAALSGVLIAPFLGLDAGLLTLLVVQAFGAVAVGRFASLPLTYLGGLGIGVGASLLTKWVTDYPALRGLPSSLPFLVLFLALILFPPRSAARPGPVTVITGARPPRPVPAGARLPLAVAGAGVLAALPEIAGAKLPAYINGAGLVIVFASLALLVRTSGQISLCHAAFSAVGATTFAHLASSSGLGLPWVVALPLAGLAVVPLGALLAVPAIRLSGLHLALATFGFAILMERVAYPTGLMFGGGGLRQAPRPSFAHGDRALFYVTAAVAVAACALVVLVTRTRLGRLLRGLAESPVSLVSNGLAVNMTRVVVFALSAFLAGIAGALFASASGNINGRSFGSFNSLVYLVVLAVAGRRLVPSAVVAALALVVAPAYLPDAFLEHQALFFGAGTVALVAGAGASVRLRGSRTTERLAASPVRARMAEAGAGG